MQRFVDIALL